MNATTGLTLFCLPTGFALSRPHGGQDLIKLYGLEEIAASVARFDPVTGEKINKLRKSYEGHIKHLPGKNKAVNNSDDFRILMTLPDEEWQAQRVASNDVANGLSESLVAKLDRAVAFEPGEMPQDQNKIMRDVLGLDQSGPARTASDQSDVNKGASLKSALKSATSPQSPTEPPRLTRRGTKRSYNDESFEGYGEGFGDEMPDAGAVDDGDEGKGGMRKRRKRVRFKLPHS